MSGCNEGDNFDFKNECNCYRCGCKISHDDERSSFGNVTGHSIGDKTKQAFRWQQYCNDCGSKITNLLVPLKLKRFLSE